jgi:NAD(P)-dependent dehydrogenase (short-subunit alcohol dehydrogenase family)
LWEAGGTSGIGAAIGDALAACGAVVTVTGATPEEAAAARAQPEFRCRDAVALDVRDGAAVGRLIADLPRLDILVNCAGTIRRGAEHDPAVFADVIYINLNGTMRLCAAARPLLARARGAIVNTASMLSFFGGGLVPGYSASKGGIAQLTKSLAIYAADSIRVNDCPGWIATAFTELLRGDAGRSRDPRRTPLARWGERMMSPARWCSCARPRVHDRRRCRSTAVSDNLTRCPPVSDRQAVRHLEAGEWKAAHVIVQKDSLLGCWAHGIVHLLEGDLDNARYWYRAALALPHLDIANAEIAALKASLAAARGQAGTRSVPPLGTQ